MNWHRGVIFLDAVSRLVTTSEGGIYIKTVENLTIAQHSTTINVYLNSVDINVAADPEEIKSGEYIMLTKHILSVENVHE